MRQNFLILLLLLLFYLCLIPVAEAHGCSYRYCKGKRKFDQKSCSCQCPNSCSSGQKQDFYQCTCSCASSCPDNQTQNDDCSCSCKDQCSAPKTVQNPTTCACSCPTIQCDTNFSQNQDTCECECTLSQSDCSSQETFNPQTCTCLPTVIGECEAGKTTICTCVCDPDIKCPVNQKKNPDTCECECGLTQADCTNGAILNPQTCACIPNVIGGDDCEKGKERINGECVCIKKTCTFSHFVVDPVTCQCGRCKEQTCPAGQKWSYIRCQCINNSHGG